MTHGLAFVLKIALGWHSCRPSPTALELSSGLQRLPAASPHRSVAGQAAALPGKPSLRSPGPPGRPRARCRQGSGRARPRPLRLRGPATADLQVPLAHRPAGNPAAWGESCAGEQSGPNPGRQGKPRRHLLCPQGRLGSSTGAAALQRSARAPT